MRRNGAIRATIEERTGDNNRKPAGAELKQGERGFGIVEALLVFAICDGGFALTSAVYGILGAIFDWFD